MPLFCYGGLRLYRRCKTSGSEGIIAQCEGKVKGKKEMIVEESSVNLKRGAKDSRRVGSPVDIELSTKELSSQLPNTDSTRDLSIVINPIR